jgi:cobalt-zinc-cadmium efflux system outer membrane protein
MLIFLCAATALAEVLTERQALERFLAGSPEVRLLELERQLAVASARTEGLYPDGEIGFSRESAGGLSDTYLTFAHPLPITGRRKLLRQAADLSATADSLRLELSRQTLRVDVRQAFWEVLLAQEQIRVTQEARRRLSTLVEALRLREKAGDISAYDRMRAERELSLLGTVEGDFRARLDRARASLAVFLEPEAAAAELTAAGELTLPRLPELDDLLGRIANRPDVQALLREVESLTAAEAAARRKAYPEPVAGGGWKSSSFEGGRDDGYIFSITVPIPLQDRGRPEAARAAAARQAAQSRSDVLQLRIRRHLAGAWQESRTRYQNADQFRQDALAQARDLVRIAQVAYESDEAGILEMLDAWRTEFESRLRALELTAEARRSALEIERWVGEEVIQ